MNINVSTARLCSYPWAWIECFLPMWTRLTAGSCHDFFVWLIAVTISAAVQPAQQNFRAVRVLHLKLSTCSLDDSRSTLLMLFSSRSDAMELPPLINVTSRLCWGVFRYGDNFFFTTALLATVRGSTHRHIRTSASSTLLLKCSSGWAENLYDLRTSRYVAFKIR